MRGDLEEHAERTRHAEQRDQQAAGQPAIEPRPRRSLLDWLNRNAGAQLEEIEHEGHAALAELQLDALELEAFALERLMLLDPDVQRVAWAAGDGTEKVLDGNELEPYLGAAIFNASAYPLAIGYAPGAGFLGPLQVPPASFVIVPKRYATLSIVAPAAAAAAGFSGVSVARLNFPPQPQAGPLGPQPAGVADTLSGAGSTAANPAGGTVVAQITAPPVGVYEIRVIAAVVAGTFPVDATNLRLRQNGVAAGSLYTDAPPAPVVPIDRLQVTGGNIDVATIAAAGGVGSIYRAAIYATRVA